MFRLNQIFNELMNVSVKFNQWRLTNFSQQLHHQIFGRFAVFPVKAGFIYQHLML